jgi:hypothetical protein
VAGGFARPPFERIAPRPDCPDCALARAIAGEERLVVSAGKVLGTEVRHNEALVMFFLRSRRSLR